MTLAAAQTMYHQLVGLLTGKNMEGSDCGPFDSLIRPFLLGGKESINIKSKKLTPSIPSMKEEGEILEATFEER